MKPVPENDHTETQMYRFEFEMDGIDVENLFHIFNRERGRAFSKLIDYRAENNEAYFNAMRDHIHYVDELEALVFGHEVEYTKVSEYEKET